jgi:hypothetical protein
MSIKTACSLLDRTLNSSVNINLCILRMALVGLRISEENAITNT